MRDGSRCINSASFPKGRATACRMPIHVEQLFSEELVERGYGGKVQAFIVHKVIVQTRQPVSWLGRRDVPSAKVGCPLKILSALILAETNLILAGQSCRRRVSALARFTVAC